MSPFMGDLLDKYLAGGIGTYTTTAPGPVNLLEPNEWEWDWKPVWTKKR